MSAVTPREKSAAIDGFAAPRYERVREVFADNFARHGELGACVAAYVDGKPVVDLWGGLARRTGAVPWKRDTPVCMYSTCKGLSALCVLLLAQDGRLDLGAPVATYWPELAQAGKERITVEQCLGHRSGLLYFDGLARGALLDHSQAAAALARARPQWPDASRGAYHTASFGVLVREIVQRVSGESLEAFFDRRINEPLGTSYRIRASDADLADVAHFEERRFNLLRLLVLEQPYGARMYKCWRHLPWLGRDGFNSARWLQSGLASGAGIGTARSVARIGSELACSSAHSLLRPETVALAVRPSWEHRCPVCGNHMKVTYGGLLMNTPNGWYFGPGKRTFGSYGRGGSFFFADPERRVGFCYAANRSSSSGNPDGRSQRLVAALYESLPPPPRG